MTEAFAFQFLLRNVEDIEPVGNGADCKLHWFALTDGFYWLSTPLGEALRYTVNASVTQDGASPYVDYYVACLFDDLLYLLPYALEPVPEDIALIVSNSDWYARSVAWFESIQSNPELCCIWSDGLKWWSERKLDTHYLKNGPSFQFWRVEDSIHVRWDSHEDGESIWLLPKGEFALDAQAFTSSCFAFLGRVIEEMQLRVNSIEQGGWLRQDCTLDVPLLVKEQNDFRAAIQTLKDRRPNTDWNVARERINHLRRQFE
jgi:hypothetical protein